MATNPMREPVKTLYEALEALPEGYNGEIVDGQLHAMPRPAPRHLIAASALGSDLFGPFHRGRAGPGGWWIIDEPEIHFVRKTEVVVPNIAGWRRERMASIPDTTFFETVPDWLCEIASPSTSRYDRFTKLPLYARYGVPFVWLIDPVECWLEVHMLDADVATDARGAGGYTCSGRITGDGPISQPPFETVAIDPPWL